MNFEIRYAVTDDLDALNDLNKDVQAIHFRIDPEFFKSPKASDIRGELRSLILDENGGILIAAKDDAILGFISYKESALPASGLTHAVPLVFIHHMGVKSVFRKQGVGTALLKAVDEIAKDKGISRIQLDVWTRNTGALQFFRKRGFRTINEIMMRES